jgi:xanthosine utilization system XapX-like protein
LFTQAGRFVFVIENGVSASGTRTADRQTGSESPELQPHGGAGAHAQTPDPASQTPGDDHDRVPEHGRGAARAPFQEFRRDNNAVREPPRQVTNTPDRTSQGAGAREVVTVRQPAPSLLFVLVLVVALLGAGLLAWQLHILQGQMNDLRAAVAQNDKIADAAGRLGDAATQANEIAGQSLASSTRPWVGVDAVQAGPFDAGQPLNIEVRVRNSGRTPSTDVQGLFLVYISPLDNPPALLADQCASCVRSVLLPEGVASYKLSVRDSVMTADEVQRIRDGKDTMWIVGRLDYHDGEGEAHTTRSCLYYRNSGIASFTACSSGNSAN